jgi:hypothetical protein
MQSGSQTNPNHGLPVQVRLAPRLAEAVDAWRRDRDGLPTRPEAIRRLLEQALTEYGLLSNSASPARSRNAQAA